MEEEAEPAKAPRKRRECPECERVAAIGDPPEKGETCQHCDYDPSKGLSDDGWSLARITYIQKRNTLVTIRHPDAEE